MPVAVGFVVLVGALAAVLWFTWLTRQDLSQLRRELDESQRQVNDLTAGMNGLRAELAELESATQAAVAAPPPLPRTRSGALDDLREQLRAAHREETSDSE